MVLRVLNGSSKIACRLLVKQTKKECIQAWHAMALTIG
jgi:hypothetical protein